jgi:hypothetical protein
LLDNAPAAAKLLGLKSHAFLKRLAQGKILSNGRPLAHTPALPERTRYLKADGTWGREATFLHSDVEAAHLVGRPAPWNKLPPLPPDGMDASEAATLARVSRDAIRNWCQWDPHPLLGRKIRSGKARDKHGRPVQVSRADIEEIVKVLDHPRNVSIPGYAGTWVAEGIYRDSKGLWYTNLYLQQRWGILKTQLSPLQKRGQLQTQDVVWPSRKMIRMVGKLPGVVIVNHDAGVEKILQRRGLSVRPKLKTGEWLDQYKIWNDAEGHWYSTKWLADRTGRRIGQIHNWIRDGRVINGRRRLLTKFQKIQRDFIAKKGGAKGSPVPVFHESEVWPFLGEQTDQQSEQATPLANGIPPQSVKKERGRSGRKHDKRSLRIQCFCYLERQKTPATKMATICRKLGELFGVDSPINTNADVRTYKNRWLNYKQKNPIKAADIEAEPFPETLINHAEN